MFDSGLPRYEGKEFSVHVFEENCLVFVVHDELESLDGKYVEGPVVGVLPIVSEVSLTLSDKPAHPADVPHGESLPAQVVSLSHLAIVVPDELEDQQCYLAVYLSLVRRIDIRGYLGYLSLIDFSLIDCLVGHLELSLDHQKDVGLGTCDQAGMRNWLYPDLGEPVP